MWKILNYSKKYTPMILLAIGLLFAQANLELALPDYLSDVVDTGVQQGGIENAVPLAIRQKELNRVMIFLNDKNKTIILENYILVNENSSDFGSYVDDYPALKNEPLYLRKKISSAIIDELDRIIKSPLVVVFGFEQQLANPVNATKLFDLMHMNYTNIPVEQYPDYFFTTLSNYPDDAIKDIMNSVTERYTALGETLLDQFSVVVVQNEYEQIGMDTEKIQTMYNLRAGGLMLLVTFLSVLCAIGVSYLAAKTAAGMAKDIRSDVFTKVESYSST